MIDTGFSSGHNERLAAYLHSLEPEREPLLKELRNYAAKNNVPIVREETEAFLRTVARLAAPSRILEIGTAIAYSTIVLAESSDAVIVTMESYDKRIPFAMANIRRAGLDDRITLIRGDAGESLKSLDDSFDLIFLDAAKAQYIVWLPDIMRLMHKGSVLIADNVLQDNTVIESRFTVQRRERTTHERMREFLRQLKTDERLSTSILPVGDGVSFSVKIS